MLDVNMMRGATLLVIVIYHKLYKIFRANSFPPLKQAKNLDFSRFSVSFEPIANEILLRVQYIRIKVNAIFPISMNFLTLASICGSDHWFQETCHHASAESPLAGVNYRCPGVRQFQRRRRYLEPASPVQTDCFVPFSTPPFCSIASQHLIFVIT